ncbi:unnamed protein product [Rhizophagus irregularis]|uniref:Protein kinase domain-containing protein n=1 Tax=Rhizophagus irregularis TaxID=588596 RepID=A0A915ZBT3_9GLOM|nr:unnamed protein product [Rhizophagus irregularis]
MALDIARGLKCLHARNIVHRDLHAKNILIHKNRLMIADLGLSKQLTVEITSTSYVEPQFFTVANYVRNKKSDIYISNGLREEPISDSPPEYVDLYQKCWDVDPNIRPTSDEVVDTLEYILSNIKEDSKIKEDMNISEDSKIIKNTEYTNITEDPNITNDSKITNDPMIKNDLIVTNDSKITHNQMITDDSKITNNLMISDDSKVANDPMIIDDSNVANDSIITNDPKIIISNDSTNTNDPIITNDSKITGDSKKDEKHDRSESSPLREYKISKPLPLVFNNIEDESRLLSSILDEIVQVYLEYNNIGWTNNFDFDEVLEKYKSKARKIFDYLIENSNIKHYELYQKNNGISDVSSKIEEIEKELERGWFRRALKKPSSDSIFNL